MTQLRFHPGSISNYFDDVLKGIGKRGSSFSDIDAVSHDRETRRFLIQEFKAEGEPVTLGQHWMLKDLAQIPQHFTVWHVVRRADGLIGFAIYGEPLLVISVEEYQRRFRCWWYGADAPGADAPLEEAPHTSRPLTANDLRWR